MKFADGTAPEKPDKKINDNLYNVMDKNLSILKNINFTAKKGELIGIIG